MTEEEKPKEEGKEEDSAEESAEDILTKVSREREMLAKETDRREKLLREEKEFFAKQQLSGRAEAGKTEEKPKEETPKEYMERVMKGDAGDQIS